MILQAPKYIELSKGLVGYWTFDGKDMAGNQKPRVSGVFGVDRGGVEPLEQGDDPTPENRPDSALVHEYILSILGIKKSPLAGALRVSDDFDQSRFVTFIYSIAKSLILSIACYS